MNPFPPALIVLALVTIGVTSMPHLATEGLNGLADHLRARDCPHSGANADTRPPPADLKTKRQLTFDPTTQHVSTTGPYAWVAPNIAAGDERGPCPGLNALANHGYLSHNGIADISTIINAVNTGELPPSPSPTPNHTKAPSLIFSSIRYGLGPRRLSGCLWRRV